MAEKELKTAEELKTLLDEAIWHERVSIGGAARFIKIISADPDVHGANWTVAHSGEAGGFAVAIDSAQAKLKKLYDMH